ncbi:MAG: SDR family NAD(P)-dependent oxidoreductase, partial [Elusimicrobia bacterium]|nr:SDR family NAD(P)-dependent oxidoreductase [Elusimicrobiota bacterium]
MRILITGAAARIGRAVAQELARHGAKHILIHYRGSQAPARALARELLGLGSARATPVRADLENFSDVEALGRQVLRLEPELNAVVFNAAVYYKTPFGKVSRRDWDRHFDVNLKSAFFLAQKLAPALKKNSPAGMGFIADWSGVKTYPDYLPYCLSKTGAL